MHLTQIFDYKFFKIVHLKEYDEKHYSVDSNFNFVPKNKFFFDNHLGLVLIGVLRPSFKNPHISLTITDTFGTS